MWLQEQDVAAILKIRLYDKLMRNSFSGLHFYIFSDLRSFKAALLGIDFAWSHFWFFWTMFARAISLDKSLSPRAYQRSKKSTISHNMHTISCHGFSNSPKNWVHTTHYRQFCLNRDQNSTETSPTYIIKLKPCQKKHKKKQFAKCVLYHFIPVDSVKYYRYI